MRHNSNVGKNMGAERRGMQVAERGEDWLGWTIFYIE